MELSKVQKIIDKYDGNKSWLVMILQDIQEQYHYLPAAVLEFIAEKLSLSLSHLYNVATFYSSFSLTERGRHLIRVCDGTACHLRGSTNVREQIVRQLGIDKGQTTKDKRFSLEVVACLGACALAPVMTVDAEYHGGMTPEKISQTLDEYD
jgi:NADH-quinone oxidoreductase subunit E